MKKLLLALFTISTISHATPSLAGAKTAILAGGCFWCVESDFEKLDGVLKATSGYTGGSNPNPTYRNHSYQGGGQIPHLEAVKVQYDDTKLSYEDILDYYFRHIDPTDGTGQFCDRGPSYRPAIFVENDKQRSIANAKKKEVMQLLDTDIKVEILDAKEFWPAEDYHQGYARKNPRRYELYRWGCGRDKRVKKVWGDK